MAPPALRMWMSTWSLYSPCFSSWSSVTASLTAVLNDDAWVINPLCFVLNYVRMTVLLLLVCVVMCLILCMRACIGQYMDCIASWWMTWSRLPFFWLEIFSVAAVQVW